MANGSLSFSAAHKARVLLVDDHPIVRQGLALTLGEEPDLGVCGQVAGAREALDAVPKLKPHVVLVDLGLDMHSLACFAARWVQAERGAHGQPPA